MSTIQGAILLVALLSLIPFFMLVVHAFRRGVLWGLAVLLVPFSTPVYAYLHWREVKGPFLGYLLANVAFFALVAMLYLRIGTADALAVTAKLNDGSLTREEAAAFMEKMGPDGISNFLQMMAGSGSSAEEIAAMQAQLAEVAAIARTDPAAAAAPPAAAPKARARAAPEAGPAQTAPRSGTSITPAEAHRYVGESVTVVNRSGIPRHATLTAVDGEVLEFTNFAFGGEMAFRLKTEDIDSMTLD